MGVILLRYIRFSGFRPVSMYRAMTLRYLADSDTLLGNMTVWRPLTALAAATIWAQAPNSSTIDTDQVHVLLATEQPHRRGAMHEHKMNRVMVYLDTGITTFTRPDDRVYRLE